MNNRENTFFDATIPNNETVSGIRPVSIGSIALLQMIENPLAKVMITGGEIPVEDSVAMLQFCYIHFAPLEEVTKQVIRYKAEPELFLNACLNWGMTMTTDKLVECVADIMRDRDNIKNAKTKPAETNEGKNKSKNAQRQI